MPPNKLFKETPNGGLIVHADALNRAVDSSVKIPQTDTAYGAGFGETFTDNDLQFAAEREPVGNLLTYQMAADITDKWFMIGDPDTEEADPALDRAVQDALMQLKYKRKLREAIEYERIYGWSLIIGAFTDAANIEGLKNLLRQGSELKQLSVYPKTKVTVEVKDENPNSQRFGEPIIYKIDRGTNDFLFVHYSRVCKVQTRSNGVSVLAPVWDDLTCGRNIRWGAAQWMYRNGGGFPVFGFPAGTTEDKLEAAANSGIGNNLMVRKFICIAQNSIAENNGMTFDFKGAAGAVLNPQPFFQTNDEQIAKGSGVPQPKLIGAQAGAVTGSEVNMQGYYKIISRIQESLEDVNRWVIDRLADSGQITLVASATATDKVKALFKRVFGGDYRHKTAKTYVIEWNSAFELSELDEARLHDLEESANQKKLDYMTKDEVRAEHDPPLDPLPNDEGASITPKGLQLFNQQQNPKPNDPNQQKGMSKEQQQMNQADKFLLIDLSEKKAKRHEHADSVPSG